MTFDYMYHLTKEEVQNPISSKQWAGQYNRFVAIGRKKEKADPLRDNWKNQYLSKKQAPGEVMDGWSWQNNFSLSPSSETLATLNSLPVGSFLIQFKFKLLKPYISRDDNQFHIIDPPLVRDKVFKWPLVRPSSWKGSLRHTLWQSGHQEADEQIKRLFGAANETEDTGQVGRLYSYPTFFSESSLEIINPHDRETRTGKNPILIESVPQGTTGTFTLLYVPLDRIGENEDDTRAQAAEDLRLVAEGLQAMFTVYGFGAKTSSGFGVADDALRDGTIVVGGLAYESEAPTAGTASPAPPQPDLPRYLVAPDRLHPDFASETGGLKSKTEYRELIEAQGKKYAKRDKQLYAKAKSWWEREGEQLAQQPQEPETEPEPVPEAPPPYPLACESFDTFADLPAKAQKLADALRQMGGEK